MMMIGITVKELRTVSVFQEIRQIVIQSAHVVKDYTNKAKTDMFLSLSER